MIKLTKVLSLSIISFVFVFTLFISHADAKSLYVSPTGNDSVTYANNSVSSPWRTVQHAANQMVAGDTTYIRGGTYNERRITFTNSGTAGNPITIMGYPGETAVIDGGYTISSGRNPVFNIDGRHYITLDGLSIRRGSMSNIHIAYDIPTNNITIRNSIITDYVTDDNAGAIYLDGSGASDVLIENNIIHGRIQGGVANNVGNGIKLFQTLGTVTIRNNEIYNQVYGIHYKFNVPGTRTTIVENNLIYNTSSHGIGWTMNNGIIRNNLIYNVTGVGIQILEEAGCNFSGSNNNQITHNTIVNVVHGMDIRAGSSCQGATGTVVMDNIVSQFTGNEFRGVSVWAWGSSLTGNNTTIRYNLIDSTTYSSPIRVGSAFYPITLIPSSVTSGNNLSSAPVFINSLLRNYTLTSGSPGKNAASDGTDMGAEICRVGVNASCSTNTNTNTFYVSTTGNDSNPGTISSPWRTVQKAASTLTSGQTAIIRGGTYNERRIAFTNSGTAGNPITIRGYAGETAIIDGQFTVSSGMIPVFYIDGKNYITLDGLTITRGSAANVFIGYDYPTSNITVQNSRLTNFVTDDNSASIYVNTTASDIVIQNNYINGRIQGGQYNNVSNGIVVFRAGNLTIQNNEISNVGAGIYYKHSRPGSMSTLVQNNLIHDTYLDGILWAMHDAVVRNNIIYNTAQTGIRVFEEAASCDALLSNNNQFLHNTIVNTHSGFLLDRSQTCVGAVNTLVRDNVISGVTNSEMRALSIYPYMYTSTDTSNTTFSYNLIHSDLYSSPVRVIGSYYTTSNIPSTVTTSANLFGTPVFQNPSIRDYTIVSGFGNNSASDGTDMGALVCAVGVNASCGGTTPPPPPPPPTDTTAPSLSNGNPTGTLPTGTVSTTLSLSTNENSTCRYSTTPNVAYSNMSNTFTTTGGTSHSRSLTGLVNGTTYNYYVRCMDLANNANGNDYTITFNVANTSTSLQNECSTTQPGRIWCDDFETDRLSSYFEYDNNGGDFARASSVGVDGSTGMRAIWQPGEVNAGNINIAFGARPSSYFSPVDAGTSNYRDVYWRMYVKHQPGWIGGGADKLSRATIFATTGWAQAAIGHVWAVNTDYLALDPASGTDTTGNLRTTTYNDFANLRWLGLQQGTTPLFNSANVGQWYCVEAHMKLNDAGQSNGVNELWINDNLQARQTNLNWVGNYNAYGINSIFFENYWNSGSPTTQQRYFDNIVVSTQRIGCGTTTTPPPPPPSDTTPPTVSISSPTGTVSGTVTVSASASDNVGVSGVQFRLNGVNLGVEDTTSPYATTWNTTTSANGTHTLTAVARDSAGNTTTSQSVSVTVSNTVTPPPPPPVSTRFTVGQRIQTTANVNVRSTASATGLLLGTQPTGSLGTVVSGGSSVDGYYWWNVNYDSGVDGYSVETFLTDYIVNPTPLPPPPPPPPSPTPLPPPPPPSTTITAGDRVQTTVKAVVRASPGGKRLGTQARYAKGTVTEGPTTYNGYSWYKVNYDSGVDGWTRGDLLTKVSSSTAMSETEIRNSIASIYLLIQQLQEQLRKMGN